MPYPAPRGSPRAVLAVATLVTTLVLACDRSVPTAPSGRFAVPAAPSADVDPDFTPDPNVGCWVAPDSSVFEGSQLYGGIFPYTFTRCGVRMNVWWPGFSNGVDWPHTAVFPGYSSWNFPWGHRPGFCCVPPPDAGFPWTITFDSAVRDVRVYTRWVDFPGGVVRVKGRFGGLIAEKPIPVRPVSTAGERDTISFPDTNVYIVEIVPDRDPNFPPDANYPDRREYMGWQAQFQPAPCPPTKDTLADKPEIRRAFRDMLDSTNAWGPRENREEKLAGIWKNSTTEEHRLVYMATINADPCSPGVFVSRNHPGAGWELVAVVHTHPFRGATANQPSEITPPNCLEGRGNRRVGRAEYTPSDGDWVGEPNDAVPWYIVSKRFIVRYDRHLPTAKDRKNWPTLTRRWMWDAPRCRLEHMRPPPASS